VIAETGIAARRDAERQRDQLLRLFVELIALGRRAAHRGKTAHRIRNEFAQLSRIGADVGDDRFEIFTHDKPPVN